jgi:hypothetical protein
MNIVDRDHQQGSEKAGGAPYEQATERKSNVPQGTGTK